jgi:hypothetical protein
VETLRVATNELLAAADRWHGLSADLGGAAPCEVGLSRQASAAAVNALVFGSLTTEFQPTSHIP